MTGRCRLCGEDFYNLLLLVRSNPWSRNLTGGECALSFLFRQMKYFQQECKVVALTTHSSGADMTGDRWLAVPERDSEGYGQFHEYWLHDSTFPSDSTSYCTGVKCGFWRQRAWVQMLAPPLSSCMTLGRSPVSLCFSAHLGFCEDEMGSSMPSELESDCSIRHHSVSVGKVRGSTAHNA